MKVVSALPVTYTENALFKEVNIQLEVSLPFPGVIHSDIHDENIIVLEEIDTGNKMGSLNDGDATVKAEAEITSNERETSPDHKGS